MTLHDAGDDVAAWVHLPWDSNHFGFPIGRLLRAAVPENVLFRALKSSDEAGIRCLYWLSNTTGSQLELAQLAGFKKVDVRVEMEIQVQSESRPPVDRGPIRIAGESDLGPLMALAARSHRNTRFYADGAFAIDRADAIYAAWIERSFHDPAQVVFVSGFPSEPDGYVACDLDRPNDAGVIGLIAVAESSRGSGLGTTLVRTAIRWFIDHGLNRVRVVTQGGNGAALALYKKLGFATTDTSIWFHRWSDPVPWI